MLDSWIIAEISRIEQEKLKYNNLLLELPIPSYDEYEEESSNEDYLVEFNIIKV